MAVTVLTTRGYVFGHPCHWDDEAGVMRYDDTNEVVSVWGGEPRPCPQCHQMPTPEGYDPCLGYIPGAHAACCGHGVERGNIEWPAVTEREASEPFKVEVPLTLLLDLAKRAGITEDDDLEHLIDSTAGS